MTLLVGQSNLLKQSPLCPEILPGFQHIIKMGKRSRHFEAHVLHFFFVIITGYEYIVTSGQKQISVYLFVGLFFLQFFKAC